MSVVPLYINGWDSIAAQAPSQSYPSAAFWTANEPDYGRLLPRQRRRWSRMARMTIATALRALEQAPCPTLDAIIAATAWGEVHQTEQFLNEYQQYQGQVLSPTAFIQSTHNSLAGQLALLQNNHGYNTTHTQRQVSFEMALLDALLLAQQSQLQTALLCAADVLTPLLQDWLARLKCATPQRPIGEGAHSFVVARQPGPHTQGRILGVEVGVEATLAAQQAGLERLLEAAGWHFEDIEAVLTPRLPVSTPSWSCPCTTWLAYEPWCGHYPVQTAFALDLLLQAWQGTAVAKHLLGNAATARRVVLHQDDSSSWAFVLVEQVDFS